MIIGGVTHTILSKELSIAFINKCVVFSLNENLESSNNQRLTITALKDVYKTSDVDFNFVSNDGKKIDGFFIVLNGLNKYYFTFESNTLIVDGLMIDTQSEYAIIAFYNSLISKKS